MYRLSVISRLTIALLVLGSCAESNSNEDGKKSIVEVSTSVPRPIMPNVICLTLQVAQDLIQDSGVFYSRSEDFTGQNRNQIADANWIVVEQNVRPGERFGEGDVILKVLKKDEARDRGICQ